MKYLTTKFKLQNITLQQFHNIIVELHNIEEHYNPYITNIDKGWIISYDNLLGYHIEDQWIYEYIYNDKDKEIYISLDDQGYSDSINLIEYLRVNDYISHDNFLYVDNKPFYIEDMNRFFECEFDLPILYLNSKLSSCSFIPKLAEKLEGMAHVVYGNKDFNKVMMSKYGFRDNSYLIYLNDSYLRVSLLKNESDYHFIERLFLKVQNYNTVREYKYPYSMDKLYKTVLKDMIDSEKENENNILTNLEISLMSLEDEKKKIEDKIKTLDKQIMLLKDKNSYNKDYLSQSDVFPILFKGIEKEYYPGEQKDMVLYVLKESKKGQDSAYKQMIDEILGENPKVGNRDEMIEEIERTLKAGRELNDRAIVRLKKCGVTLDLNGHYDGRFYDDPRYLISIGSSPSDYQFANQLRRHIKKFFF